MQNATSLSGPGSARMAARRHAVFPAGRL